MKMTILSLLVLLVSNVYASDSFDASKATEIRTCSYREKDIEYIGTIYETNDGKGYVKIVTKSLDLDSYGKKKTIAQGYAVKYSHENKEIIARTFDFNITIKVSIRHSAGMISFNESKDGTFSQKTFYGAGCW